VREEMDAAGFQEVHFPALLPREPYEATNRWTEYGPNLFRLQDRRGVDYLLGPTHEEMFTLLVKDLYSSYKDLPLSIYQIQTKFRDEARPRAGGAAEQDNPGRLLEREADSTERRLLGRGEDHRQRPGDDHGGSPRHQRR
jgi:seryl-tRNA synthetase